MAGHFTEIYEGNARSLVFGEGSFHSRLMMIGEAPGEQETLKGRPFVGKAGKNLDEFLQMSGLKREEIYITNTVKFRPTKRSDAGRLVNRPPTKEEIALFLPWLKREIALVAPGLHRHAGQCATEGAGGRQGCDWRRARAVSGMRGARAVSAVPSREPDLQSVASRRVRGGREAAGRLAEEPGKWMRSSFQSVRTGAFLRFRRHAAIRGRSARF